MVRDAVEPVDPRAEQRGFLPGLQLGPDLDPDVHGNPRWHARRSDLCDRAREQRREDPVQRGLQAVPRHQGARPEADHSDHRREYHRSPVVGSSQTGKDDRGDHPGSEPI